MGPRSSMGSPITLMMRPRVLDANRNHDGAARVNDLLATSETIGGVHGNGANGVLSPNAVQLQEQGEQR